MAETDKKITEYYLRQQMNHFLSSLFHDRPEIRHALEICREKKWSAFLCGGAVRDLLLEKSRSMPRDLDIVVNSVTKEDLIDAYKSFVLRENRFEGLSVYINDWKIDIWPLSSTWAFEKEYVPFDGFFSDYTKTTFLNIEAIVVELFPGKGRKRKIASGGFFESVEKKILEINLEANPDPEVNIARAIYMSVKYQFCIGPHLTTYIYNHMDQLNKKRIVQIYRNYLKPNLDEDFIDDIFDRIREKVSKCDSECLTLCNENNKTKENSLLFNC